MKFVWLIANIFRKGFNGAWPLLKKILEDRRVRFTLVGGAASASYFGLGLLFVNLIGMPVLVGNALAYALSFIVSYLGQSMWTFRASGSHMVMLLRFGITQLMGLGINFLIVGACVNMGIFYPAAMAIAICVVPVFVYLICKYWVFRNNPLHSEAE